ncbi:cupin domain-containing protein [Streptosporangium sp. NPDC000396]|uniref:cupin domain-containing protein n=1 Tax=Streptosporangium sp. NPDC000396 TaxID=3366185 RepID=UPI0036C7C3FA
MPVISGATAPVFTLPHVTAIGLAAPSRGAKETCAWRFTVAPGTPAAEHSVDREEVFVLLSGGAIATLDGVEHPLVSGDALIVPPGTPFGIANPYDEPLEMVAVLPVGGRATMPGGEPFVPPWAQ